MSEAKHTPGPWVLVDGEWSEKEKVITTQSRLNESMVGICEMDVDFCGPHGDQQEANARLISAAPDLFHALVEIVAAADGDGWKARDAGFKNARAAIAKATGQA